jgi:3-hydroxypropanoate dehydrogenase
MTSALNDPALDQIFRSARTPNSWADRPVEHDTVRAVYDLMKWGPTSANSSPARFVWVRSADGKATLAGLAAQPNKPKILKAPVTVIIGHDLDFAAKLPSNFICGIGYGDPASVFPRNPRLSFEEAGRWA